MRCGAAEAQTQEKVGGWRESIFHIFLSSLVGVLIPGGKEWHINYLNAAITLHIAASNYIAALMLFSRRSPKNTSSGRERRRGGEGRGRNAFGECLPDGPAIS